MAQPQPSDDTPSRADGISADAELVFRSAACTQLMGIGQRLGMKKSAIGTACVLFQRFYTRRSFMRFDRLEVALVCLVIAGKTVDFAQPLLFKTIVPEKLQRAGHAKPYTEGNELWKSTKDSLVTMERTVLSTLEFDVAVDLPFAHVDVLCAGMGLTPADHPLREVAVKMLNDLLKTPVILDHPPRVLACAALAFAKSQLETMARAGRGPAVDAPAGWDAAIALPPGLAHSIVVKFSDAVTSARKELARQLPPQPQAAPAAAAAAAT